MEKKINSTYMIYAGFFIIILMMVFTKDVYFELIDESAIKQIIHPEYPKGGLSYMPHYNCDYFVAFVGKMLGLGNNLKMLAQIFWFVNMSLIILVLSKLSNFIFKNNRLILTITVLMFLLLKSGEIDQKTMAMPVYLLAIYYFLKEKWNLSALFAGLIFYLHIGLGLWWFLPSSFALIIMYLKEKKVSLKQIINYGFIFIATASWVLYFYIKKAVTSQLDAFSINYYYYTCGLSSSTLLAFTNFNWFFHLCLVLAMIGVGYYKARKLDYKINSILPIVAGIFILFILTFIFSDVLRNPTAVTLQLLRSIVYIELFAGLFFAFLLSEQIKRNYLLYVVVIIFILTVLGYGIITGFTGYVSSHSVLNIFYVVVLSYEVFENIKNKIYRSKKKSEEKLNKINGLMQNPVVIICILGALLIPKIKGINNYLKSIILNRPQNTDNNKTYWSVKQYLTNDIASFVNKKMRDDNILFLAPFLETDLEYHLDVKTFLNYMTPHMDIIYKNKISQFKYILENDFNYSLDDFFVGYSKENFRKRWYEMWKNINESLIWEWKTRYQITHVIREKELPLDFPVLYQNKHYVIYEIK